MYFSTPALTSSGAIGCQHSRCNRSYWRQAGATSSNPGTQAWVVIGSRYDAGVRRTTGTVVTLCSRHSATVRSLISRGTSGYSTRTYRFLEGVSVDLAAGNRDAIGAAAAEGYDAETRAAEAARRQYIEDNRSTMVEAHLSRTAINTRSVSVTARDEYGRAFVSLDYRSLTPGAAEALASALLDAAARARAATEGGNNA